MITRLPKAKGFSKAKRNPRPKRYPKPKIKKGGIFEFEHGFPYLFVGHLNATYTPYTIKETKTNCYRIEIHGKPIYPHAKMIRKPMPPLHGLVINIVDDIAASKERKEKNKESYEQLKVLIEKFRRAGRKTVIHCPIEPSRCQKDLTICLARCGHRCGELSIENIMGPKDTKPEFFRDLLKLQRLVNVIYGTVRIENHFKNDN